MELMPFTSGEIWGNRVGVLQKVGVAKKDRPPHGVMDWPAKHTASTYNTYNSFLEPVEDADLAHDPANKLPALRQRHRCRLEILDCRPWQIFLLDIRN